MRIAIIALLAAATQAVPAFTGGFESSRASSERLSLDLASLPGAAVPAAPSSSIEPLGIAVSSYGDITLTDPPAYVPEVLGEMPDEGELTGSRAEPFSAGLEKSVQVPVSQVPADLLRSAVDYLNSHAADFGNRSHLGIIDFSQHSSRPRFYIMDLGSGEVRAVRVAHGRGSDPDHDGFANSFSNQPNSNASSLGFYRTGDTYNGKHGRSMRLHGLSSTNSNAFDRAVVIHEADYVQEAGVKQGRSFGCPAVAASEIDFVISSLGGGALIYGGLANSGL